MILPWRSVSLNGGPPIPTSLTEPESQALAKVARDRLVLEVGSAYGYSATLMAQAGARHVLAVDPHRDENVGSLEAMRENLLLYDVEEYVTILLGDSQDVLAALVVANATFGLAFIDGDHHEDAVYADLTLAHLLAGEIACHDYGEERCGGVARAWDRFVADYGGTSTHLADSLVLWYP